MIPNLKESYLVLVDNAVFTSKQAQDIENKLNEHVSYNPYKVQLVSFPSSNSDLIKIIPLNLAAGVRK